MDMCMIYGSKMRFGLFQMWQNYPQKIAGENFLSSLQKYFYNEKIMNYVYSL